MRFGAPLGFAAAALIGPLIAWYVLRSRRPRQVVASTFLWARAERTVAAAVPWQKFRGDVTFWLVLLALLLGAGALARPYVPVAAELGDHTILVMDASGSMLATEDGPSRLTLARRAADDMLSRMAPGQEVSVVEAGARGRVLVSSTDDPSAARRALQAIRPTHGPADWVDAFTLAAALERPGQQTVVHLLTDGVLPEAALATTPLDLRITSVGEDRPNLAISRVQAQPQGAGQSEVLVQVRNWGRLPVKARVTLLVSGEQFSGEVVDLGPRATRDLVLTVQGGEGDVLLARVEPVGTDVTGAEADDALNLDDDGFALLTSPQSTQVILATPGNVFLQAALESVQGVELTVVDTVPGLGSTALADADLLVVDRLPAPAAPVLPMLLVAPTVPPAGITDDGTVDLPALTFQSPDHPLLAEVSLGDVAIAEATAFGAPALTTVASAPGTPLIQAGRLDRIPVVLFGFDLLQTNLPLQAAYPVLIANTVTWLTGPPAPVAASAGQSVTLSPPAGTDEVRLLPPSGEAIVLDAARPVAVLDQVGLWKATWLANGEATGERAIAVNASVGESDLSRPRPDSVASGARSTEGGGAPSAGDGDALAPINAEGRRPFAPYLLMAILGIAIAEWIFAHRRRRRPTTTTTGAPSDGGTPRSGGRSRRRGVATDRGVPTPPTPSAPGAGEPSDQVEVGS